jgi:hypothetical protein
MKKTLLLSIAILSFQAARAGNVTSTAGELHGRPVTILENGLVRLAVTPGIGGRVLEFADTRTGRGSAKVRRDNIAKRPDDDWAGADYGGFCDVPVPGLGWPGDFWGCDYKLEVTDADGGGKSVVASAEQGGIGLQRTMTLAPGSTALTVETRLTNLGAAPRVLRIRFHNELAAGSRADDADDVFFISPDGPKVTDYVVGAEYARMEILRVTGGWVSLSDTHERASVIKVPRAEGVQEFFYWAGANEAAELVGADGAFVGLDWMGKEETVAPGGSLSAAEVLFLADGIGRPGFVNAERLVAGEVLPARDVLGSAGKLEISAALAGAQALPASKAEIEITGALNAKFSIDLPAADAGLAVRKSGFWDYKNAPDGAYEISAKFTDAKGNPLGSAIRTVRVDSARVDAIEKRFRSAEAALKRAPKDGDTRISTEREVLEYRLSQAAKDLEEGSYSALESGLAAIERETERLKKLVPDK